MRMTTATTALKMPLYGISFLLSASSELLTEASKPLFLIKGLLLSGRNLSGHKFHKNSDIQDAISLRLEKLCQSNFAAAKSSYGLSRLIF